MRRHRLREETNEFLFAQLAACVVNFSMARPKQPARVKDFMPSRQADRAQADRPAKPKRKSKARREAEMQAENDRRRAFYDGLIARQQRGAHGV